MSMTSKLLRTKIVSGFSNSSNIHITNSLLQEIPPPPLAMCNSSSRIYLQMLALSILVATAYHPVCSMSGQPSRRFIRFASNGGMQRTGWRNERVHPKIIRLQLTGFGVTSDDSLERLCKRIWINIQTSDIINHLHIKWIGSLMFHLGQMTELLSAEALQTTNIHTAKTLVISPYFTTLLWHWMDFTLGLTGCRGLWQLGDVLHCVLNAK